MAKADLKIVDENFTAPQGASNADVLKAHQAAGIREGKRRAHEQLADTIAKATTSALQPIKQAHTAELERSAHVHSKAAYWRGFAIGGMIVGALVGTALAIYAAAIINPAFDAAARMQMQQSVVDTMQRGVGN